VTEEEKNLINIKYNIKRLNTLHNKEMLSFQQLKSTIGVKNPPKKKMKTFVSDISISKINDQEDATNCDSVTKRSSSPKKNETSSSPKKNERYSKILADDVNEEEDFDDLKLMEFQKTLSMPLNAKNASSKRNSPPDSSNIDNFFSEMRIDEIEEDVKSIDDLSLDEESEALSKKPFNMKPNRGISEKK